MHQASAHDECEASSDKGGGGHSFGRMRVRQTVPVVAAFAELELSYEQQSDDASSAYGTQKICSDSGYSQSQWMESI